MRNHRNFHLDICFGPFILEMTVTIRTRLI